MDAKYVATFLLVAVMITRIQCGTGDDCSALKQCTKDAGFMFQDLSNITDAGTIRKLLDAVCRNIDALVNCWKPIYVQGCTSLTKVFDDQSVVNKMRDMLKKSCAQKEGVIDAIACLRNDTVSQSVQQCYSSESNNQGNQTTGSCSELSVLSKCLESKGQCSAEAVSFVRSIYEVQFDIICSAPQMVVNVLLLCMLYLLNRLLLF